MIQWGQRETGLLAGLLIAGLLGCGEAPSPSSESAETEVPSNKPIPPPPPEIPASNDPYLKALAATSSLKEALNVLNAQYSFNSEGQLTRLALDEIAVTDDSLPALAKHKELRALYLYDTRVTDAGLAEIKPLKQLNILVLTGSPVSPEAVENLRTALPNCLIFN